MAGASDHMVDCSNTSARPLTHGADARRSPELVEAAYQSIKTGRAVRLPPVPEPVAVSATTR